MQEPQKMQVRSPGQEDPLEEGRATHSNILAWRIPWTEEPGVLWSMRSQRVGHDLSSLAQHSTQPHAAPFGRLQTWSYAEQDTSELPQGTSQVGRGDKTLGLVWVPKLNSKPGSSLLSIQWQVLRILCEWANNRYEISSIQLEIHIQQGQGHGWWKCCD